MPDTMLHSWDITPAEGIELQKRLAGRIRVEPLAGPVATVAGADCAFAAGGGQIIAAAVLLDARTLEVLAAAESRRACTFPYVPGLLGFREVPVALEALVGLSRLPDLLMCDGQGFAHPRRFGLACHLGLLAGLPSVGAAKSRLIGTHAPVGEERGAWQPLYDGEEVIGAALRTRPGTNPLYISAGHRVSLASAIDLVLRCAPRFRLPEPTRQAHRLASGR